jgi:hypothetical protein
MQLSIIKGTYTIHRLAANAPLPAIPSNGFFNIVKTDEELSVVCLDSISIDSEKSETGWALIKLQGPFEFSMTGVIAKTSAILAEEKISVFVISTFDTDYVMVKSDTLNRTKKVLSEKRYTFI